MKKSDMEPISLEKVLLLGVDLSRTGGSRRRVWRVLMYSGVGMGVWLVRK